MQPFVPMIVRDGHLSGLALFITIFLPFPDAGMVPNDWRPLIEKETVWTSTDVRDPASASKYCARCQHWKPPRCHHCS